MFPLPLELQCTSFVLAQFGVAVCRFLPLLGDVIDSAVGDLVLVASRPPPPTRGFLSSCSVFTIMSASLSRFRPSLSSSASSNPLSSTIWLHQRVHIIPCRRVSLRHGLWPTPAPCRLSPSSVPSLSASCYGPACPLSQLGSCSPRHESLIAKLCSLRPQGLHDAILPEVRSRGQCLCTGRYCCV